MAAPFDFKGLPLGISEAVFAAAQPDFECDDTDDPTKGDRHCVCVHIGASRASLDYGGARARTIAAMFVKDRLIAIAVYLDPSDFETVGAALRAKFGKPTSEDTGWVQNRAGAKFRNHTMTWLGNGESLTAKAYGLDLDTATVIYSSAAGGEALRRRAAAAAKSNAKKL